MKKVKSVLDGFPGWGKARTLSTFPQILFCLLSIILPKIFIIQRVEGGANASHPPCGDALQASYSLLFVITNKEIRRGIIKSCGRGKMRLLMIVISVLIVEDGAVDLIFEDKKYILNQTGGVLT